MILASGDAMQGLLEERDKRLCEFVARHTHQAPCTIADEMGWLQSTRPLIGIASSRLGHCPDIHRHACLFLSRSVLDCRDRNGILLVAAGSAIECWAVRAAELFSVPVIKICVNEEFDCEAESAIRISNDSMSLSRDEVLVALADRVDIVQVRRVGKISAAVQKRLQQTSDASTRVAISPNPKCDAGRLIQAGAVGWYHADASLADALPAHSKDEFTNDAEWTKRSGEWLVHCTRAVKGPWPDETTAQYRDQILLGYQPATQRGPIDSLCRILRSGQLLASSVATSKRHPVVCFTEVSLNEILSRRCYRPQLGRWDYEPFGLAIRRTAAVDLGIQPVIYGQSNDRQFLAANDQFRFHPVGKTYDWRTEKEWRSPRSINLSDIQTDDVRVFAYQSNEAKEKLSPPDYPITWINSLSNSPSKTMDS